MSDSSVRPGRPPEWPPGELDETVFRSIAERVGVSIVPPPKQAEDGPRPLQEAINNLAVKLGKQPKDKLPVEQTVATLLDTMVTALGENWIGGPWDPKADIRRHTTAHLDGLQAVYTNELKYMLQTSLDQLDLDDQIRQLLHVWRECFNLWDRSLAYRTIKAATAAVQEIAAVVEIAETRKWESAQAWQRATWCAVGKALALMREDGVLFAQTSVSCSDKVYNDLDGSIGRVKEIRDDLGRAWQQLADHLAVTPKDDRGRAGQQKIQDCVSYMWIYAAQVVGFYSVIKKMAGALLHFEEWLTQAGPADRPRKLGTAPPALRPLSLSQTLRVDILESLEYLEEIKPHLSSHTLSEIEPWEQLLMGLLDYMPDTPHPDVIPSVLIPRLVWVRYCYPFAVHDDSPKGTQNGSKELAKQLLRAQAETAAERQQDGGQPGTSRHPLSLRLEDELRLAGLKMKIKEPVDLDQTEFFQVGTGEDGHFGGIRIDLPDLMFSPKDFLNSSGPRPYQAWLDLNRMGNFCLCVEATEPLAEIPPHRLYRALRAGTPFVYGEPVTLAPQAPDEEASGEADEQPCWDNLHMFARSMIRAACNAYYFHNGPKEDEKNLEGRIAPYVRANLHEVVVVQTDSAISLQAEDIANRLDDAIGGRILLRSLQRASATLDEWTRFPPLQRSGPQGRGTSVVAVPEIGYAGDWFVHTGETTVFGVVAVPAWFRNVYFEVAQFASSWSPVLQLWNRRLQDAITNLRYHLDTSPQTLREVEQEVRRHLAEMNAEDLCSTLSYRGFLDSLLDAVGIGRLQVELETQLRAAEQLADYYWQLQEQKAAHRRDLLLFVIALFGVFGIADFLALLDTAPYHAHLEWPDVVVLLIFGLAMISGAIALLWERVKRLRPTGRLNREERSQPYDDPGHD
jgi:hypothetical protein